MLRFFLFGIVSFFVQFAFAQVTINGEKLFCNEWIQKDQSYHKLEVSKDGLYKVTVQELLAKGIDLRNKSSENLQIIHLGKQIQITFPDKETYKIKTIFYFMESRIEQNLNIHYLQMRMNCSTPIIACLLTSLHTFKLE
jgi:hypothetical protein